MSLSESTLSKRQLLSSGFLVGLAFLILAPITALTDESSEPISGLYIEDAIATPARAGETALVGFRIDNFSGRSVRFLGVRSERSESAAIMLRSRRSGAQEAETLFLRHDETLDLLTSHMWIELRNVTDEIKTGDTVAFELIFGTGTVQAQAHAHAGVLPGAR